MNMNKIHIGNVCAIGLLLASVVTACQDGMNGNGQTVGELCFEVSTEDWDMTGQTDTRGGIKTKSVAVSYVPMVADDGEVFMLSIAVDEPFEGEMPLQPAIDTTAVTRGAQKTSFVSTDKIRITAFVSGDGAVDAPQINNQDATLTYDNTAKKWKWATTPVQTWPSPTQVIAFYGVYPASDDYKIDTDHKYIHVDVPTDAEEQADLLVAGTDYLNISLNGTDPIALNFKHAMTAVQFKAGTNLPNMDIESIRLEGFTGKGTYTVTDGRWTPDNDDIQTFTASPSVTAVSPSTDANTILNSGAKTFMMIPQEMTENKQLVITTTYNGKQRTLVASLYGTPAWKKGTVVTYTLGQKRGSGYYLYPTNYVGNNNYWNPGFSYWAEQQYSIRMSSYKLDVSEKTTQKVPMPWKVTHYASQNPNGDVNSPYWKEITGVNQIFTFQSNTSNDNYYTKTSAKILAFQGTGSVAGDDYNRLWYQFQSPRPKFNDANSEYPGGMRGQRYLDAKTMTAATAVTDYDLSTQGGTTSKNTANCYIVKAQGTYKFPAVYGNGIKNGSENSAAYSGLKDYKGNNISSSTIPTSLLSGAKPVLLWESLEMSTYHNNTSNSAKWQIPPSSLSYNSSTGYISFKVQTFLRQYDRFDTSSTPMVIEPGCALIGLVNSSNEVVWSWLIYMTPTDLSSTGVAGDADRNLGQYYRSYYWYFPHRYVWFRMQQYLDEACTQVNPNAPDCIMHVQHWYTENRGANHQFCPLYKWGRAYPLPPRYTTGNFMAVRTLKNGSYVNNEQMNSGTALSDFTYPYDTNTTGRWKDNVKTIFDPCPVGWRVPPSTEYDKAAYGTYAYIADSDAWRFSTNSNKLFILPMYGTGWYMTSTSSGTSNCLGITCSSSTLTKKATKSMSELGYIRPIKE